MRCCAVLSEQVLSSCLKITLVDYKGVNVKLLKLTGKTQTPPATLLQAAATARFYAAANVFSSYGSGSTHHQP
jgi:hypothetical protein